MAGRTDLAIEIQKNEKIEATKREKIGEIELIFSSLEENNSYGKPKGKYITLRVGNIAYLPDFSDLEKALVKSLKLILKKDFERILVVGLGNREITSDNIGPLTAQKILATRHIIGEMAESLNLENLKSVSVIAPGVLGKTGIEASEIVKATVEKIKPDAVIAIDALCSKETQNLFSVIQLCDSGISPGSGVKNARKELSFASLGVPTVAIGVPTVVEAEIIARELSGQEEIAQTDLVVTPKDADLLSHRMSQALSEALNVFLQPNIPREVVLELV